MICEALVAMSDWPLGQRREVDPHHPKIIGLLRGQYIAPLVVPGQRVHVPAAAPQTSPAASEPAAEPVTPKKRTTRSPGTGSAPAKRKP